MKELGILFGVVSFCFFAFKGYQAGSAFGSPDLDFKTATVQERQAWMEEQSTEIGKWIDRSLPKGGGLNPSMSLAGSRVNAATRTINFDIRIKGPAQLLNDGGKAKRAALKKACPHYMKSPLGQNAVYVYQNFQFSNGRTAMSVGLTPSVCQRLL